jgi:uncharacterized membrane protein YgcG
MSEAALGAIQESLGLDPYKEKQKADDREALEAAMRAYNNRNSGSGPAPAASPASAPSSQKDNKEDCEGIEDLDALKQRTVCNPYTEDIIINKCSSKSTEEKDLKVFSSKACQDYCKNLAKEGCDGLFKNYCKIDKNKIICENFCKIAGNKEACNKSIKASCDNEEIITDKFCQNTIKVVNDETRTKYETIIDKYCNNKQASDDAKKDFCACYDKELIDKKFSHIKQDYIKNFLKERPQCNPNCTSEITKYADEEKFFKAFPKRKKATEEPACVVPVCRKHQGLADLGIAYHDGFSEMDKNDPVCTGIASTSGSDTGSGTGTGSGSDTGTGSGSGSGSGSSSGSGSGSNSSNDSFIDKIKKNYELIGLISLVVIILIALMFVFMQSDEPTMHHPHPYPYPYPNMQSQNYSSTSSNGSNGSNRSSISNGISNGSSRSSSSKSTKEIV